MKKSIYITALSLMVVMAVGCSKMEDFGHTNLNPAATTTPITSALLTNVLSGVGAYATSAGPALYCQYFSETQYPDFSCYSINLSSPMGTYSGNLYDLQNIIKTNTDDATKANASLNGANDNQIAIARILKAYIFWTITDRWGDIPYSKALAGDPNVTYDTQESIYKDLIKECTEAVGQFTDGAPIKGDIAYSGNTAKWQKLGNSLRMLMALRLSKAYPGASEYAATEFKAALADAAGSISDNADNFMLTYPGGNFRNPYYNMYDGRKDYGESATMTTMLATTLGGDGRQAVYGAASNGAASSLGVPYGRARDIVDKWCQDNPTYTWVFAPSYRQQTSPAYIVTAAQVLLARAEAADRGWTSETANTLTLYKAGVSASYTQWGLAAPADAYFLNANVALSGTYGTGANTAKIATQQWVAYYPDGIQGWANWRRTNVPALTPAPDAINNPKVIPRRYMYGTADYTLTKAGVDEAVNRMAGGDKMDSRVWWDK